jgi:hypothetical protein
MNLSVIPFSGKTKKKSPFSNPDRSNDFEAELQSNSVIFCPI